MGLLPEVENAAQSLARAVETGRPGQVNDRQAGRLGSPVEAPSMEGLAPPLVEAGTSAAMEIMVGLEPAEPTWRVPWLPRLLGCAARQS